MTFFDPELLLLCNPPLPSQPQTPTSTTKIHKTNINFFSQENTFNITDFCTHSIIPLPNHWLFHLITDLDGKKTVKVGDNSQASLAYSLHCFSVTSWLCHANTFSSSGTFISSCSRGLCHVVNCSTALAWQQYKNVNIGSLGVNFCVNSDLFFLYFI